MVEDGSIVTPKNSQIGDIGVRLTLAAMNHLGADSLGRLNLTPILYILPGVKLNLVPFLLTPKRSLITMQSLIALD
jgi:hypothetical protein